LFRSDLHRRQPGSHGVGDHRSPHGDRRGLALRAEAKGLREAARAPARADGRPRGGWRHEDGQAMSRGRAGEPLHVVTVCGVGMGSSLILRMTAEKALAELGVPARVEATDVSSAKSLRPDVILGQEMHMSEFAGAAPIVLEVANFIDTEALKRALEGPLREQGWLE